MSSMKISKYGIEKIELKDSYRRPKERSSVSFKAVSKVASKINPVSILLFVVNDQMMAFHWS